MVENITLLKVTLHSYTNSFGENHSITFISIVQSLETAEFETVSFKNHQQPLSHLAHGEQQTIRSTAAAVLLPPPSLPPAVNARTPTVHDAAIVSPACCRQQPSENCFLAPPDREAHPQTSSTFRSLPPLPPAPPHSTPRPISITSSTRDEGKVSALFALLAVTPETHLLMFDGTAVAVPWLISPPRAGGLPTPPLPDRYGS
jgi:hypothetical protein